MIERGGSRTSERTVVPKTGPEKPSPTLSSLAPNPKSLAPNPQPLPHHFINTVPQANPAPNALKSVWLPRWMRP